MSWQNGPIEPLAANAGTAPVSPCKSDSSPALSAVMRGLLRHMHTHYAEPITLADLAQLSRRSAFQIIRAFHRELGQTPHAYLVALRTQWAATMLQAGDSGAFAAASVGFADESHLARHFKKQYGHTPAAYRRSHQVI